MQFGHSHDPNKHDKTPPNKAKAKTGHINNFGKQKQQTKKN
jgi:hypothetical protein